MTQAEYAIRPNKTQLKREIRALNELGQELLKLPPSVVMEFPLSEIMREALLEARRLKKGALQRQLRHMAGLMKHEDVAAIRVSLERQKQPSRQHAAELHLLEQWRTRLLEGDDQLLTRLIGDYPQIDIQLIRQMVRNARREQQHNKPPRSARSLFQYLAKIRRQHDPSHS